MTPPPDSGLASAPERSIFSENGGGGTLPSWAPWGAFAGALVFCAAVEAALGWFTIALMLVFGAIVAILPISVWSRVAEGHRRAKDRAITMAIASAFGVAMAPLISLLYEVISRGVKGLSWEFFTSDARGVVGGGGAEHAIVGPLVITACAVVISVPIGIMAASHMHEDARGPLRRARPYTCFPRPGLP